MEQTMAVTTFNARGNDGKIYKVHRVVREIPSPTFDDPHATYEELPSYQLADGRKLNQIDEHSYEVPGSSLRLIDSL